MVAITVAGIAGLVARFCASQLRLLRIKLFAVDEGFEPEYFLLFLHRRSPKGN